MKRQSILLWVVAFLVTVLAAVYQRVTGPTYPLRGTVVLAGREVSFKLNRSEEQQSAVVKIATGDSSIRGWIEWKRYKTENPWTRSAMTYRDRFLTGELPMQPPAGKLLYRVTLEANGETVPIPTGGPAMIRFKGTVPPLVLWPHVLVMFLAILFSTRAGLEFFNSSPKLKTLTFLTVILVFVGGLVFGPIVQKYAFDSYWTGWPFGGDLTDNKTALALLGWVCALVALYRSKRPQAWALGAAIFLLLVYLIPHSLLGSELDYDKVDRLRNVKQELPAAR